MKTVKIRLDGLGGMPMDEKTLKSTYATGMDFEPDERRMTIDSEGIVSLQVTKEPYMIHVKMAVPLYGHLWVMADNQGEGVHGRICGLRDGGHPHLYPPCAEVRGGYHAVPDDAGAS